MFGSDIHHPPDISPDQTGVAQQTRFGVISYVGEIDEFKTLRLS